MTEADQAPTTKAPQAYHPVKAALNHFGLTDAGAAALARGCLTGRIQGGVAADKLVKDGFARRFREGVSAGWGKPAIPTERGREAMRVLRQAGYKLATKKRA